MSPQRLFRRVAVAEAITWALLLVGMFLKYVTETTELAVTVFGMLHGVVFVAYCVTTVVVWVDQRWSIWRGLLSLVASVPPLATLPLEAYAVRHGWLEQSWRLRGTAPANPVEQLAAWLVRNPARGLLAGAAAVVVLTLGALAVGPPG